MDSQLVLFTNYFPYKDGEEYLEAELPYLSKQFDRLLICPVMISRHEVSTLRRSVPSNCIVVPAGPGERLVDKLWYMIRYSLSVILTRRYLFEWAGFDSRRYLYQVYFATRCEAVYRNFLIDCASLLNDRRNVFYSYWLYVGAVVCCYVKRDGLFDSACVSRAHRYDVVSSESPLGYLPARNFLAAELDRIYPVGTNASTEFRNDIVEIDSGKLCVRRLGVKDLENPVRTFNPLRIELLSVSSFNPMKRLPLLIQVVGELQRSGYTVNWTHYGESEHISLHELNRLAESSLYPGSYRFEGRVSNSEIHGILSDPKWDFFVGVARSEGVPVSCMEALSAGLPILYTAVGDVPDLLPTAMGGLLVENTDNPVSIAEQLSAFFALLDPVVYAQHVAAAKDAWSTLWSSELNYSLYAREIQRFV